MARWSEQLQQARRAAGLSRRALAARAGVSAETVASYEYARRAPTTKTLHKLTRGIGCDAATTNEILCAAGLDPEPEDPRLRQMRRRWTGPASLDDIVNGYTWPCLVLNDHFEITGWNNAAVRVAERDFAIADPTPRERNMMRIAADPYFRERSVNWKEIVGFLMGLVKVDMPNPNDTREYGEYFAAVIKDIAREFPSSLPDLMQLWGAATPFHGQRNIYYPRWRPSDGAELRFNAVVTTWSDFDALHANDWQPADAATWEWLGGETPSDPGDESADRPAIPKRAGVPWHMLLRQAREQSALSRRELAERAPVSMRALDNYEAGTRRPDREMLLALTCAMKLDGAATNALLAAADYEPEPSDWALHLAQKERRVVRGRFANADVPTQTLFDVRAEVSALSWPCLVVDTGCDIIAGNEPASRVLGMGVRDGVRNPRLRNLVRFFLSRDVRDRVVNWDEAVTAIVPSTLRRAMSAEHVSPAFAPLAEALEREEPGVLSHLRELWVAAPRPVLLTRVVFPLVWRHADGTALVFNVVVAHWNGDDTLGYWSLDWHPADATTWRWLDHR